MSAPNIIVNFAYGSNMLVQRLRERVPSARVIGTGQLQGHTLRWHKAGQDASGKCDAQSAAPDPDPARALRHEKLLGAR